MQLSILLSLRVGLAAGALALLAACAGAPLTPAAPPAPVQIGDRGANLLAIWDEIATTTINQPPAPTGTASEQRPFYAADLATLHLAMHDALAASRGRPGLMKGSREAAPSAALSAAPSAALPDAAVATAAYRVLRGLFPARAAHYEAVYTAQTAAWPPGSARDQGVQLGEQAAARALALRADDGRMVALAPFVPGSAPGQFRGANPIGRFNPAIKPFIARSFQSFRAPGPPALDSARYAQDFNEVKALGGAASSQRSAEQLEAARFHTEPPFTFWPRNLRRFARHGEDLLQGARLMALLWVGHADAYGACFESKYHHLFWRPATAIAEAASDGNAATAPDLAWTPSLPVPNHPEYPSGHACLYANTAAVLADHFGTEQVAFSFDSRSNSLIRRFQDLKEVGNESDLPRVNGGMHFRFAIEDGKRLGRAVAGALREQLARGEGL